ncbi:MAG: pilus assembly protein [Paenisporosarcina sp.]
MKGLSYIKNEKGALSFEFLGILPFYFLFFLLLWQVVASGFAVMTLKSAANDGALEYALTQSEYEATQTVLKSIGGSELLANPIVIVSTAPNDSFTLQVTVTHPLVFVPAEWRSATSVSLNSEAIGKVLVP